jgi:hypothetical protein
MLLRYAGEYLLADCIVPQAQHRGCGEGPRAVGSPDLRAGDAIAFASRFFRTFDQAAVGDTILHAWEPPDVMDLVEQDQTQDFPDPRYGAEQVQGIRAILLGSGGARQTRRLILLLAVGWCPHDLPPSGARLARGPRMPAGRFTLSRVAPHRGGGASDAPSISCCGVRFRGMSVVA